MFSASLVAGDVPGVTQAETEAARDGVGAAIGAMPDVLRVGVGIASRATGLALWAMSGRPFARLPEDRRTALAQRLATNELPLLAEFIRLTRGLGLAEVYEKRTLEERA